MDKKYLFVANWKMYLTHAQECTWICTHKQKLASCTTHHTIALCPSFVSLTCFKKELKGTSTAVGAQECAAQATGAFTGQVCATSLRECGCSYAIVGHSEQRARDPRYDIAARTHQLLSNNITPIICISEPTELFLQPIKETGLKHPQKNFIIAYEPLTAIGTGNAAPVEQVQKVLQTITHELHELKNFQLLYGGSVDAHNSIIFKKIAELDGFLIGKASTDIDQLCAIINALR